MTPTHAFCHAHAEIAPVDRNWRALWIDSDGDLHVTDPERGCDLDFERPETVFACGQTCALVLTERYLHTRSFSIQPASAPVNTHPYTELT